MVENHHQHRFLLIALAVLACFQPPAIPAITNNSVHLSAFAGKVTSDYNVRQWTPAEGLPSTRIQCLAQSSDGYLWIGTAQGLARFDGVQFKLLTELNCRCLAIDNQGVI